MPKLSSILRSSLGELRRVAVAYLWLIRARLLMRRAKGREWQVAGQGRGPGDGLPSIEPDPALIKRRVAAVSRASRYPYSWAQCLQRSLALREWLARDGIFTEVKYGVRRRDGKFEAHAWVVNDGVIINDSVRHVSTFAPLRSADEYGRVEKGGSPDTEQLSG